MAYSFSTNNSPATGAIAFYTLITTLVAAGWTKTQDSDGTTYSAVGAQITSGNSGANGLANNRAWFVLKHPTSNRAFCFQRSTASNTQWRVSYCSDDAFTAGTPGATQIPEPAAGSVEVVLKGAGSAAAPTFTIILDNDNTYRFNVIAGGAAEGYSWAYFGTAISTTNMSSAGFFDVMAAGSYPASDADPSVCFIGTYGTGTLNILNTDAAKAWMGTMSVAGNNRDVGPANYRGGALGGTAVTLGTNGWTGKDDLVPIPWFRNAAVKGWKGFSGLMRWGSVARTTLDTFNVSGVRDAIYVYGFVFPWDGSIPLV